MSWVLLAGLGLLSWQLYRHGDHLATIKREATSARIHAEHARDSAGRTLVNLWPDEREHDRRYGADPPYLHTVPGTTPPWAPWTRGDYDLRTVYRGGISLVCDFCERDMKHCITAPCAERARHTV